MQGMEVLDMLFINNDLVLRLLKQRHILVEEMNTSEYGSVE